MNFGAHVEKCLVLARRMDAVGKQNDQEFARQIEPNGCAGKAGMPDRFFGNQRAAGGFFFEIARRRVPAKRARRAFDKVLAGEEFFHKRGRKKIIFAKIARIEFPHEPMRVVKRGKQPRMTRHSAHCVGVFVMHFAAQNFLPPCAAFGCGKIAAALLAANRLEKGVRHAKWLENLLVAKAVKRRAGDAFDDMAEQNKAEIAVFASLAWRINQIGIAGVANNQRFRRRAADFIGGIRANFRRLLREFIERQMIGEPGAMRQ